MYPILSQLNPVNTYPMSSGPLHPQVAVRDSLQKRMGAANMLRKQSHTASKEWICIRKVRKELTTPHHMRNRNISSMYTTFGGGRVVKLTYQSEDIGYIP
jgi:hypothetical protein